MKTADNFIKKVNAAIASLLDGGGIEIKSLFRDGSIAGGKRLRAVMFYLFSEDHGERSVKLAAAIEIFHAATLVHDDIIDGALMRRGRPVLHSKNSVTNSVLYGDYLFSSAFNLLSELGDAEVCRLVTEALAETLKGEITENSRKRDAALSVSEYLKIAEQKSGALFGASSMLGAIFRGENRENAERAKAFGINAGIAYQLTDDYLDYFGECEGKEKFKDIREGVVTLPFILLMIKGSPEDRRIAENLLADPFLTATDAEQTVILMEAAGIPGMVLEQVSKYREAAMNKAPSYALDMLERYFLMLDGRQKIAC